MKNKKIEDYIEWIEGHIERDKKELKKLKEKWFRRKSDDQYIKFLEDIIKLNESLIKGLKNNYI